MNILSEIKNGMDENMNYYNEKQRQVQAAGKIDIKKIVYLKENIDNLANKIKDFEQNQ